MSGAPQSTEHAKHAQNESPKKERPAKRTMYVFMSVIPVILPKPPVDSSRYNLNSTFDVVVQSETFSLHTTVFTERSEFLRAARKPEWLADNPKKPVDLHDEDAKVFNTYVNCIYFGHEALQQTTDEIEHQSEQDINRRKYERYGTLVGLYQLADKLQDPDTANIAIDEIKRFGDVHKYIGGHATVRSVYDCTPANSPLRRLMCDAWVYSIDEDYLANAKASGGEPFKELPSEFVQDLLVGLYSFKAEARKGQGQLLAAAFSGDPDANEKRDKCHYHWHNDKHPRCVPIPGSE